jgi:hypothetical protein
VIAFRTWCPDFLTFQAYFPYEAGLLTTIFSAFS